MRRDALRRLALACIAVTVSFFLFAPAISSALVTRGDEFLSRAQTRKAVLYYRRGLALDPRSGTALDRYLFFGMQHRTASSVKECARMASAYLAMRPTDSLILVDRALCRQFMRQDAAAGSDFERAARVNEDPRYFTLAGWAAKRAGNSRQARRLFRLALRVDPGFRPALFALARFR